MARNSISSRLEVPLRKFGQCVHCGSCTASCPLTDIGSFRIRSLIREMYLGIIDDSEIRLKAYMCMLCKRCAETCMRGLDPSELMVRIREIFATDGHRPTAAKYLRKNLHSFGNEAGPIFADIMTRAGVDLPKKGNTLVYAGYYGTCDFTEALFDRVSWMSRLDSFDFLMAPIQKSSLDTWAMRHVLKGLCRQEHMESFRKIVDVLSILGFKCSFMYEDEPSLGTFMHTFGMLDEFTDHASKVCRKLAKLGIEEIIVLDSISAAFLMKVYPEFVDSFSFRVTHYLEAVAEKIAEGTFDLRLDRKTWVTYHDPCYLARYLRIVEEPRQVMGAIRGVEMVEPPNNRYCTRCDGGGGLESVYPALASEAARARAEELLTVNPDMVVTECPVCVMMLKKGLRKANSKVGVSNLIDLLHEALTRQD